MQNSNLTYQEIIIPAHPNPAPVNIHAPTNICLLDEEFDIFEITRPCDRHSDLGQDMLPCDDDWDEYNYVLE